MDENTQSQRKVIGRPQDIVNTYVRQEQSVRDGEQEQLLAQTAENDSTDGDVVESVEAEHSAHHVTIPELEQCIMELETQLKTVTDERNQLREQYIRLLAEMENIRKRTEREKEQIALLSTERLFARLVELLDDLTAALDAGERSRDYDAMLHGLEMITTKAHKLYEEHGVRPFDASHGEPFNVDLHEALIHLPHPELPEGTIIQQVQRGYTFRDRVLRHARVITSAGESGANGSTSSQHDSPSTQ